jgi:hypothetical protein
MPQLTRHYCSRCQIAIYNCMVNGVRVPILLYFVIGQPEDTGEFDVNGPGVMVPSFVREIMQPHVPFARAELCINCVSDVFGLALVTAEEDPMYSVEQSDLTAIEVRSVNSDKNIPAVEKAATAMDRVFTAIEVGRGAMAAPALPPVTPPAPPAEATPLAFDIPSEPAPAETSPSEPAGAAP